MKVRKSTQQAPNNKSKSKAAGYEPDSWTSRPCGALDSGAIEDAVRPNSEGGRGTELPPDDRLLNVAEAARYLGMSKSWLNKQRLNSTGPQFFKVTRRVLYRRALLDAWLDDQLRQSTADHTARNGSGAHV